MAIVAQLAMISERGSSTQAAGASAHPSTISATVAGWNRLNTIRFMTIPSAPSRTARSCAQWYAQFCPQVIRQLPHVREKACQRAPPIKLQAAWAEKVWAEKACAM